MLQRIRRLIGLCSLLLLVSACSFPGIVATTEQLPVVKQQEQGQKLPPIRLPQDEAAHHDLTEWWYYTGHLNATDAQGHTHPYGFELVIFQALRSDLPPTYLSHFAITDLTRNEFHYDQRRAIEVGAAIPDGSSTAGINERVGDWTIQGVNGQDRLQAAMSNYAINLQLSGVKPAIMHNGNGLIAYGAGGFSYYYSRPRMDVVGSISDHGQQLRVTGGTVWMDHQWGNFLSLGGGGWDWYSIQLNNNTEMMLYVTRDPNGKPLTTYADYIDEHAQVFVLPADALHITSADTWTSRVTGIRYPSGWQVSVNATQVQLSLQLQPLLKDQELVTYNSTGNVYWEGAVGITGQHQGQAITGQGYVELTGYTK